ncbi:MAG TPA: hypothetical protein VGG11_10825 [Xanthobacteraceae bacterium]
MLMFVVGFVAAIILNFVGWLLLAEARETELDEPLVRFNGRHLAGQKIRALGFLN